MHTYIQKIESGLSFKKFYFYRFIRFFPIMMIGAVVYEVLVAIYVSIYKTSWFGTNTNFWGMIIDSLGIQAGWAFQNPCVNNPTWYISVLMLCYVVFYIIVFFSERKKINPNYLFVFMIFLGIGIRTYGISLPFLNEYSCRGYYAFFFGLLLAELLSKRKIKRYVELCCLALVVIIPYLIYTKTEFMSEATYIMTFIFFPALIIVFKSEILKRIMNCKFIGLLGLISFDVFIWHNSFYLLMYIFIKFFNWNLNLNSYFVMIGCAVVCYCFGFFSYFCIEKPIKKRIDNYIT